MQRQRVASRALASVGYDDETLELELEFRSGRVYRYRGVPRGVWVWLLGSKNKGAFVTRMIAGRYAEQAWSAGSSVADEPSLEQALRASLDRLSDPTRG